MSEEWRDIFENLIYVPPSSDRLKTTTTADESFPFAFEFRGVVFSSADPSNSNFQLRTCFYDSSHRRFFGRPWSSQWFQRKSAGPQPKEPLNETIYFHSPYKDNNILLIVECIGRKTLNVLLDDETVIGWTGIRLVVSPQRRDALQSQLELFQGSAATLSMSGEPLESNSKLRKSNSFIQITLKNHAALERAYEFVPANVIIGSSEPIPGLERTVNVLADPVVKASAPAVLDELAVHLGPMSERIDSEVCELLNKERLFKENINPNGETMMILEKRIRVGVHNGWTYLHEPYLFYLTSSETFDTRSLRHGGVKSHARTNSLDVRRPPSKQPKGLLVLRNRVELDDLYQDTGLALVFYLEYILGLQTSKPNPPAQVVTIAWGAWSPFAGPIDGPVPVNLVLRGGPSKNPDYVLCFRDYYSLAEGKQQIRNKIEIQMKCNFVLKKFLPPEEIGKVGQAVGPQVPPGRQKPQPQPRQERGGTDHTDSLTSSRGTTPAPPPRDGRRPLSQIPKQPIPVAPGPDHRETHYPFVLPYPPMTPGGHFFGAAPSFPAYPMAAPLGHMTELPMIGDLHAPILALQRNPVKSLTIPRAIMAILISSSFDIVEDRHGDPPELVDIFDMNDFSLDADFRDPLTCNEIIFQFMAIGRSDHPGSTLPENVFFTFQFYRFPPLNTERLLAYEPENVKVSGSAIGLKLLRRLDASGQLMVGKPGFQVKFIVDPHFLKPGESKLFIEYLYYHFLYVDVWDADSLMLIGSCLIPMRQLCRRGNEAVHAFCQLPIVTTEIHNISNTDEHGGIRAVLKSMLYLRVACVGYPSAGGVGSLVKDAAEMSRNIAVVTHRLARTTIGTDLDVEKLLVRPRSLMYQYPNLKPMLIIGKKLDIIDSEFTEEQKRKITRVTNLRQIERYSYAKFERNTRTEFTQDIQTIKHFRERTKDKTILSALFQSLSVVHTIFPTLGSCEFVEFLLANPYSEPCTLTVDISDPDLKVVVDQNEWQFFKNAYNLLTPLETSMFVIKKDPMRKDGRESVRIDIFLKPKENVYVPFKFQTFAAIAFPDYEKSADRSKATMNLLLQNKTIRVLFKNTMNNEVVSVLILQVEPQPHVVHQSFRFYQAEQTFLSKFIRINLQDVFRASSGFRSVEAAYCTDPTVLCEINEPSSVSGTQDIFVKVPCGNSPQVKSFNIMLYVDRYLFKPVQIWQLHVHALQKLDLTTVQGHGARFSLVLKGGQANRVVRCFSSSPVEMVLNPKEPFILQANSVVEVQGQFKPMFTGERTLQITAVDVELKELLKAWLIYAVVRPPNVTKGYQVTVPIGQTKSINKKLSFTNKYSVVRTFTLMSSREDLMTVKDAVLHLQPGASGVIGLRFNTNVQPQVVEIMLFINDEMENNEEAYGIKAVFVAP